MTKKIPRYCASVLLVVIVWEVLSLVVHDARLLPGVDFVLRHSLPSVAQFAGSSGEDYVSAVQVICIHVAYTLLRLTTGMFFGTAFGFLIGMGVHFFGRSHGGNALALSVVRSVPLFALIPLFLYWFGGKEMGTYLYICFAVTVVIATNTYEAVCNVAPEYAHQAKLLGASRLKIFASVYAPAIGPEMIGSLRNVFGLAWAFTLGAEYLSASPGLGYLVYQSYIYSDMGKLLVFALLYGILGMIGYLVSNRLLSGLRRWHVATKEQAIP